MKVTKEVDEAVRAGDDRTEVFAALAEEGVGAVLDGVGAQSAIEAEVLAGCTKQSEQRGRGREDEAEAIAPDRPPLSPDKSLTAEAILAAATDQHVKPPSRGTAGQLMPKARQAMVDRLDQILVLPPLMPYLAVDQDGGGSIDGGARAVVPIVGLRCVDATDSGSGRGDRRLGESPGLRNRSAGRGGHC